MDCLVHKHFSRSALTFFADETPVVKFGTQKELESIATGESQTYTASDFCFINGMFIDPGFIHDVLLTDLKPSTVYYYSCGVSGVRSIYQ